MNRAYVIRHLRCADGDMEEPLLQELKALQQDTFEGEQGIPGEMILSLFDDRSVQWWCAMAGDVLLGAVAAWEEAGKLHWGRFAVKPFFRHRHIGSQLAKRSFDDLFTQGQEEIYMEARDATVKIVTGLGGEVVGPPVEFYKGTVTPVLVRKERYKQEKE